MNGICKLTKKEGAFVKCHLMPKALTRPSRPGSPFLQSGSGSRPIRRWDSWYDTNLVTREGEDILSTIDDAGIAELREHGLLWSGRQSLATGPSPDLFDRESGVGTRVISGVDIHALRMFFLSLLWRCAASKRSEVSAIELPERDLEKLRLMIVEDRHTPIAAYPFTLTQLLEVGPIHNFAPVATTIPSVEIDGQVSQPIPVFRFYLDGLIANIVRDGSGYGEGMQFNEKEHRMFVITARTATSFQILNLTESVIETELQWPNVATKIVKPKNGNR